MNKIKTDFCRLSKSYKEHRYDRAENFYVMNQTKLPFASHSKRESNHFHFQFESKLKLYFFSDFTRVAPHKQLMDGCHT